MKAENYNKVVQLMGAREKALEQHGLVEQSNCLTFSKDGRGRVEFEILIEAWPAVHKFKETMLRVISDEIKAIDDKLAEL